MKFSTCPACRERIPADISVCPRCDKSLLSQPKCESPKTKSNVRIESSIGSQLIALGIATAVIAAVLVGVSAVFSSGSSQPRPDDRYYDPSYRPSVRTNYVEPYFRSDGAYVPGHYRTNPDGSFYNNWSTKGNVNPHTGERGYRQPPTTPFPPIAPPKPLTPYGPPNNHGNE